MISSSKRLWEVLENIRMSTHSTSSETLGAIIRERGQDKITEKIILNSLTNRASAVDTTEGLGFGEGAERTVGVEEVAAIFADTRSPVGRETAEGLFHEVEMFEVFVGVVEEATSGEFVDDAAHGPHVSGEHPSKTKDDFGRAVVASGDDGRAGVVFITAATKIADADTAGELGNSATSDGIRDEFG